jgi:hypothetical protein
VKEHAVEVLASRFSEVEDPAGDCRHLDRTENQKRNDL